MSRSQNQSKPFPLPKAWWELLGPEFDKPYMKNLSQFLREQRQLGKRIFPPTSLWFNAFWQCPLEDLKVVILGQDPYHGLGQAHGLSFSVPQGVPWPPSLLNIFKELSTDIGLPLDPSWSGDLTAWSRQGVLLLNATLTVEEGLAGSHQRKGWEQFTDQVIRLISQYAKKPIVFVLWGSFAHAKIPLIDETKHVVLKSAHPSPLSAHRGFFGSKPFSKVNQFLASQSREPIQWDLIFKIQSQNLEVSSS
jgi:uracil-DNA glycosylase